MATRRNILDKVWVIQHSWPQDLSNYTVMPDAYASEIEALRQALRYTKLDPGHKYEVVSLTLSY